MTISVKSPMRAAVLLTTIAAVVLLLANALAVGADASYGGDGLSEHVVVAGDTLWDIAAAHTAPGDDVRVTVGEVRRLNGLSESTVYPGQVLLVPGT